MPKRVHCTDPLAILPERIEDELPECALGGVGRRPRMDDFYENDGYDDMLSFVDAQDIIHGRGDRWSSR